MPASLAPPNPSPSWWKRLRTELFGSRVDGLISIVLGAALVAIALGLLKWIFFQAQWTVIQANSTLFAVGRYPIEQQWRLWLLTALLAAATGLSWGLLRARPRDQPTGQLWPFNDRLAAGVLVFLALAVPLWLQLSLGIQLRWWGITALVLAFRWAFGRWGSSLPRGIQRLVPLVWPVLYLLGMVLISGGLGLIQVAPSQWGGLLLTLVASSFAILICFPLGLVLALGRRSELPLLRWGSVVYIEFIRGAPLITLLFLGQNILGFLLPGGLAPDRVWRAAWVLTFFAAAYVAEALRSGLAAVPRGQLEAAQSLGMTMPQGLVQVVLPQAVRVALPAVVGQFITLLQDTTLLSLIGLLDLLGTARAVMANPAFLGKSSEVYLVLAVLFWCCCAALGLGSRALETRLNPTAQARYQR
jgi:general L-amino acid transport system permease protein